MFFLVFNINVEEYLQVEKKSYAATNTWNLKYETNKLVHKTEIDSQTQKTNLQLPKGIGEER